MASSASHHIPHHVADKDEGCSRAERACPDSAFGGADAAVKAALYLQVQDSCFWGSMWPPRMGGRDECAKYLQVTSNAIWSDLVAEPSNEQPSSPCRRSSPSRRSPEQAHTDWSYYLRTWGIFEHGSEDGPARGPARGPENLGAASAEGQKKTQEFVRVLA
jgi:hypothetical protein